MTSQQSSSIQYIREDIPDFQIPAYSGGEYEALVPDTLDFQERAALAVNGLTGPTDAEADYEIYWKVCFASNPPFMQHDWSDGVQVKFMESLPLMRIISGSDLNDHVDRRWMEVALRTLGPDGLSYTPVQGRPWARLDDAWGSTEDQFCNPCFNGRLISAMKRGSPVAITQVGLSVFFEQRIHRRWSQTARQPAITRPKCVRLPPASLST